MLIFFGGSKPVSRAYVQHRDSTEQVLVDLKLWRAAEATEEQELAIKTAEARGERAPEAGRFQACIRAGLSSRRTGGLGSWSLVEMPDGTEGWSWKPNPDCNWLLLSVSAGGGMWTVNRSALTAEEEMVATIEERADWEAQRALDVETAPPPPPNEREVVGAPREFTAGAKSWDDIDF